MPVSRTITAVFILSAILCGCQRQVYPTGFDMETILSEQRDGYVCSLIGFNVGDGERVRGYLLVPDTASPDSKAPAVVLLHDHGARFDIGKEKLVRPLAQEHIVRSAEQWADRYFDGIFFGDFLASEGFTVIVADAIYWGERSSPEAQEWSRLSFGNGADMATENPDCRKHRIRELKQEVYEGQREIYANYEKAGRCWAEKILEDDIATAELVASLPFVDTSRIYAAGFSMGAHRCWLLSAFSDRIRRGAAVCWMTEKASYASDNASDLSMRIPAMRDTMDFPDIARLTKPKPMLFISGEDDHLFPEESVRKAFSRMQAIYSDCTPSTLITRFVPGGHHCGKAVQDSILHFFISGDVVSEEQ